MIVPSSSRNPLLLIVRDEADFDHCIVQLALQSTEDSLLDHGLIEVLSLIERAPQTHPRHQPDAQARVITTTNAIRSRDENVR